MKLFLSKKTKILGFSFLLFLTFKGEIWAGSWDGVPPGYGLAWSDEFNGTAGNLPNPANWNIETNSSGEGNAELEYYSASYGVTNCQIVSDPNAVDGSSLAIIATDPGGNNGMAGDYHSARIDTSGLQQYGANQANTYYVARVHMPYEVGTWPAFWTLGSNYSTVGWPACGETDIMENFGAGATPSQLNINMGSLHFGTAGEVSETSQYNLVGPGTIGYNTDYHTFAALSTSSPASMVQFFVDGQLYETDNESGGWPYIQPEYIILNMAIGGDAGTGAPNATTVFPVTMLVDYVRVYQQGSPTPTPVVQSSWYVACGDSSNYVSPSSGITWLADTNFGFENGLPAYAATTVSNTSDSQLYQYNRYLNTATGSGVTYAFSVPTGSNYQVTLKFAEDYFTASGDREFNYSINGTTEATNFDIFANAGGEFIAVNEVYNSIAPNANGQIVLVFTNGSENNAQINAIQIIPQPGSSTNTPTYTATGTPTFTGTPTVTFTPTDSPSRTATSTASLTQTPTASKTATNTPTSTMTGTATLTATGTLTQTNSFTPTPTATVMPSSTPTATVTLTSTPTGFSTPTNSPTLSSTVTMTETATNSPIQSPSLSFTSTPTLTPNSRGVVIGPVYPNPVYGPAPVTIQVQSPTGSTIEWSVFTTVFRKVLNGSNLIPGNNFNLVWNLEDQWQRPVANGLYYLKVRVSGPVNQTTILKVLVDR